jgi:hypothetical protein
LKSVIFQQVLVGTIAERRFLGTLAGTEIVIIILRCGKDHWLEFSIGMRTITKRLFLAAATAAPVDGLTLLEGHYGGPGARKKRNCQNITPVEFSGSSPI